MKKNSKDLWGLSLTPWLEGALASVKSTDKKAQPTKRAKASVGMAKTAKIPAAYATQLKDWQKSVIGPKSHLIHHFEVEEGPFYLVTPLLASQEGEKDSQLKQSSPARYRDAMGVLLQICERNEIQSLDIDFETRNPEELTYAVMGLEMAAYRFKRARKGEALKLKLKLTVKGRPFPAKILDEGMALGLSMNISRHLTNLPPNELNPHSYSQCLKTLFQGSKTKVDIWHQHDLKTEKMNLHLAVGLGAGEPPCMVLMKYRGGKGNPVALVGKGITFDTGGLDIKPAAGMRLMKKDMGGSAAVVGLMYWAQLTKRKLNLDGYLALAENAVSENSFRPSDVVVARNGQSVEIHNTDAEGRLVLADVMDVAVTRAGSDKPKLMIDVATLTGAIKGALGASMAGLFSNNSKLCSQLFKSSQQSGDLCWPMPLYQKYRTQLNSTFADMVNCSDGFGGAITAALFLEGFAKDVPWAHLDIYAWKDAPDGAWAEAGGSGQAIQLLAHFLTSQ